MFDSLSNQPQKGFVHLSQTIQIDNYDTFGNFNFGSRAKKSAQKYVNSKKLSNFDEDEDSGVFTPPLWPELSPESKTLAIAKGKKELMEMVQDMPESCYELSLRDLVDRPTVAPTPATVKKRDLNLMKRFEKRRFDNGGVILKMGFPINFGPKKVKNFGDLGRNSFSKIPAKFGGTEDEEWWMKRRSVSMESESGSLKSSGAGITCRSNSGSSGSGSSGSSSRRNSGSSNRDGDDFQPGCWSFIFTKT